MMNDRTDIYIEKQSVDICKIEYTAQRLVKTLMDNGKVIATAESCTGGLIGSIITEISGASGAYVGGMITYTNEVKINVLGVAAELIEKYTAVSSFVAEEMAVKIREKLSADIGISATGYAGPTGGSEADPVGTVYMAISSKEGTDVYRLSFFDGAQRHEIRYLCTEFILQKSIDKVMETQK